MKEYFRHIVRYQKYRIISYNTGCIEIQFLHNLIIMEHGLCGPRMRFYGPELSKEGNKKLLKYAIR